MGKLMNQALALFLCCFPLLIGCGCFGCQVQNFLLGLVPNSSFKMETLWATSSTSLGAVVSRMTFSWAILFTWVAQTLATTVAAYARVTSSRSSAFQSCPGLGVA
jgi:hypothetical protein